MSIFWALSLSYIRVGSLFPGHPIALHSRMKGLFLIFILVGTSASAAQAKEFLSNDMEEKSWYVANFKDKLPAIPEKDLAPLFDADAASDYCESTLIHKISMKYGPKNVAGVLILARKFDLIDDVVLDILFPVASRMGQVEPLKEHGYKLERGDKKLTTFYSTMFSEECVLDKVALLESEVSKNATPPEGFMSYLHQWAKEKRLLSEDQYLLVRALSDSRKDTGGLRLKDYASKREKLRELLTERPQKGTLSKRSGKITDYKTGHRYQLYSAFSITQIKTLSKVMAKLNQRIMSDRSEITFYQQERVTEKIDLGPMEQVKLSLKIYQREKNLLQQEDDLKGKPISFQQLLTLSFELGKISNKDLEYLGTFPHLWDRKKGLVEKVRDYAQEYGFVIPLFTGAVGGYAYLIGLTILDNYVENGIKKKNMLGDYTQDLFYGSCDVKGL